MSVESEDERDQIRVVVSVLKGNVGLLIRDLAFDIQANLVETSPYATGWFRINWVPSVAFPFEGLVGTREDAEAGYLDPAPAAAGLASIAVGAKTLAETGAWITNNVPYGPKLNDGHSQQAPAGFVQDAVDKAVKGAEQQSRDAVIQVIRGI